MRLPTKSEPRNDPLRRLGAKLGCEWPAITAARQEAERQRVAIWNSLRTDGARLLSDDVSIVVFGSLARGEWTTGSDVDWTLLIDGQADPQHLNTAHWIAQTLADADLGRPGPTGVFGNMAFSHEIIHQIGGQHDSNRNTTQRVLLLLESAPVGEEKTTGAYERVVRGILDRYLLDDPARLSPDSSTRKLPRFLLNDVVRFWRTMAVDYASKRRERGDQGWALRNAKLRMSRKLIFCKGLLSCFGCVLTPLAHSSESGDDATVLMITQLRGYVGMTALDVLAESWLQYPNDVSARQMLNAYDQFVAVLNDQEKRKHLETLKPDDSSGDATFMEMRDLGNAFQEGLTDLFFGTPEIFKLTKKYGVF